LISNALWLEDLKERFRALRAPWRERERERKRREKGRPGYDVDAINN
jgi:hypothetical protein